MMQRCSRNGFMLADAITGLAIIGTLLAVIGAAIGAQNRPLHNLADSRAAWRNAEARD